MAPSNVNNLRRNRSTTQPRRNRSNQRPANDRDNRNRTRRTETQRPSRRYVGCGICKADHRIITCKKFLDMNLAQRYKTALDLHYCVNCLARNHLISQCNNKIRCQRCGAKHHSLLHGPQRILNDLPTERSRSSNSRSEQVPIPAPRLSRTSLANMGSLPSAMTKTFVPTAVIQVVTEKKNQIARALLNPSLTTSRIAVSFVRDSNLKPFKVDDQVFVKVKIASNSSSTVRHEIYMLVVSDLPKPPYPSAMDPTIKDRFCRISLADPEFYTNSPVAIEIGGDLYTGLLKSNVIHIDGGTLVAHDSALGWLVMGSYSS